MQCYAHHVNTVLHYKAWVRCIGIMSIKHIYDDIVLAKLLPDKDNNGTYILHWVTI